MCRIFLKSGPQVLARHKWLGADVAMDWFGRLLVCHNLLGATCSKLFAGDEDILKDDLPADAVVGFVAAQSQSGEDTEEFKVIYKQWKKMAHQWACKYPGLLSDLLIARLAMFPQVALMEQQLFLSSCSWDRQQLSEELRGGKRSYRLLECFRNHYPKQTVQALQGLLHCDLSAVLGLELRTVHHRHQIFRAATRAAAATHHYLVTRHQRFPYKMFSLLGDDADKAADDILSSPACCRCEFTKWFLKEYDSKPKLLSQLALQELRAIALECSVDIASTECQHAANRRLVTSKGVQTWAMDVREASAHFFGRRLRLSSFIGLTKNQAAQAEADNHKKIKTKPGPRPIKPKQTRKFFPKHFAKGKNLCRGGGAWTVFLSEKKMKPPKTEAAKVALKQLREEYKTIKADAGNEWDRLCNMADNVKQAQKHGAKRVIASSSGGGAKRPKQQKELKKKRKLRQTAAWSAWSAWST